MVALSPLVGGESLKGPTAKIMRELGLEVSVATIARHYAGLADALLVDPADAPVLEGLGVAHAVEDVVMRDMADRERVGHAVLALARVVDGRRRRARHARSLPALRGSTAPGNVEASP